MATRLALCEDLYAGPEAIATSADVLAQTVPEFEEFRRQRLPFAQLRLMTGCVFVCVVAAYLFHAVVLTPPPPPLHACRAMNQRKYVLVTELNKGFDRIYRDGRPQRYPDPRVRVCAAATVC